MEVRWEHLTPPDFEKLAADTRLCVLPIGSLERHGDHLPFGTDGMTAHHVAHMAAEKEPCVVFPPYWFGQLHEAACFTGTVNFPQGLLLQMLETLLDQIARNGFEKILIINGHGGNRHFLEYFAMTQLDRRVPYTLYITHTTSGPRFRAIEWESGGGHADERETSIMLALTPGDVRMEQQGEPEPIDPKHNLEDSLPGVHSGLWWYAQYPQQVSGCPSKGTRQKGEAALGAMADDLAETLRRVKADTLVPALQQEFYTRLDLNAGAKG